MLITSRDSSSEDQKLSPFLMLLEGMWSIKIYPVLILLTSFPDELNDTA